MPHSHRHRFSVSLPWMMCSLLLWPMTAGMIACGSQDDAQADGSVVMEEEVDEEVRPDGKSDVITPPKEEVKPDPAPFVEDPDRYPMFETVRYVKRYRDCKEPICMLDMRFGIRGGTMSYYQRGMMVRNTPLFPEDRAVLREFVARDSELGALLFSKENIPCELIDERRVDHTIELELSVYTDRDTLEHFTHVVSHCPLNMAEEIPDTFIDFINEMNAKY